jgi:hypothetical protein
MKPARTALASTPRLFGTDDVTQPNARRPSDAGSFSLVVGFPLR